MDEKPDNIPFLGSDCVKYPTQREEVRHGTFDFPLACYRVNRHHPRYEMMLHWHPELEIIRVERGTLILELDGRQSIVQAGDTVVVGSGVCHSGHPLDSEYVCLVFDMRSFLERNPMAARTAQLLTQPECRILSRMPRELPELDGILDGLIEAMEQKGDGYTLYVQGALYQLFAIILRENLYTVEKETSLRRTSRLLPMKNAVKYIEEHYATGITLDDLSRSAGMSRKYFCSYFRGITGKTPMEYLNGYRIEKACELLLDGDRSVATVAGDCGFNDVSYFARRFRQAMGTTPLEYRKGKA